MSRTIRSVRDEGAHRLAAKGIRSARREAAWLMGHHLGMSSASLVAHLDDDLSEADEGIFAQLIGRREKREPLQYILGVTTFFGLEIEVNPSVLIPRPETEELVACVLDHLTVGSLSRVADLGTGSGCIALAIKSQRPESEITGYDIDSAAVDTARRNAARLGLSVQMVQADMLSANFVGLFSNRLDVLVSNPPYVSIDEMASLEPEVSSFEPHGALFSIGDPVRFYRALDRLGHEVLAPGGSLVVECHADRAEEVADIYRQSGYQRVVLHQDISGRDRIVAATTAPQTS